MKEEEDGEGDNSYSDSLTRLIVRYSLIQFILA